MYEYKFIKIRLGGLIESKPKEDYHLIIENHVKKGWRLIQIFSPPVGTYGTATYFELIFERVL